MSGLLCFLVAISCVGHTDNTAGSYAAVDSLIVVEHSCRDLITAQAGFMITEQQINSYFASADTIMALEASHLLAGQKTRYYVSGKIAVCDTFDFFLFPSGVTIVSSEPELYLKGPVSIPTDEYEPVESPIRILSFNKYSLEEDILKYWQQDDPDGYYSEGGILYEAYKRWEETVFANEVCRAFALCRPVADGELNVSWDVDHHSLLYGYLIKDGLVCGFWMNGGGVIEIYPSNSPVETYACYDPRGLDYFTSVIDTRVY